MFTILWACGGLDKWEIKKLLYIRVIGKVTNWDPN